MVQRKASVVWEKDLQKGSGNVTTGSGAFSQFPVTWASRTEDSGGKTSPEELLAAAHASCFAMALSSTLAKKGTPPDRLDVSALTYFEKVDDGWKVTKSELSVKGRVPGIDEGTFGDVARAAEKTCPISKAIRNNVEITLSASLV